MKKVRVTQYGDGTQHVSRQPLKESWRTHASLVDLQSHKVLKALDAGETGHLDTTTSIDTAWQGMDLGSPRLDDGFAVMNGIARSLVCGMLAARAVVHRSPLIANNPTKSPPIGRIHCRSLSCQTGFQPREPRRTRCWHLSRRYC
ncbi:MAG: hypothetical protein ACTHZI_03565 [Luteimonas sp.]|jgi:hypothetical protein